MATLVLIGVLSGIARILFPSTLGEKVEPIRRSVLTAFNRADPFVLERTREIQRVEGRFDSHRSLIVLHALSGIVFLVLAPLQLSPSFRSRHITIHRRIGAMLILVGVLAACSGLYFGVLIPAAGLGEAIVIVLVGSLFLVSLAKAIVSIRTGRVERHREWMMRAFAVALGISTVRIVAVIADFILTPSGMKLTELFVLSLWLGWGITLALAETWIVRTRRMVNAELQTPAAA